MEMETEQDTGMTISSGKQTPNTFWERSIEKVTICK